APHDGGATGAGRRPADFAEHCLAPGARPASARRESPTSASRIGDSVPRDRAAVPRFPQRYEPSDRLPAVAGPERRQRLFLPPSAHSTGPGRGGAAAHLLQPRELTPGAERVAAKGISHPAFARRQPPASGPAASYRELRLVAGWSSAGPAGHGLDRQVFYGLCTD